jgi:hypothetical protein
MHYKILDTNCWEDILRCSSGDEPLLLLEARESKDMNERPKMKKQEGYYRFIGCLCLSSKRS